MAFLPLILYRVRGALWIDVPSLKSRPSDIEPLISHFCKQHNERTGQQRRFLAKTVRYLEQYDWPGNIRDLRAMVREVLSNSDHEKIEPQHLNPKYFKMTPSHEIRTYDEIKRDLENREREYIKNAIKESGNNQAEAARRLGLKRSSLHDMLKRLGLREKSLSNETTQSS